MRNWFSDLGPLVLTHAVSRALLEVVDRPSIHVDDGAGRLRKLASLLAHPEGAESVRKALSEAVAGSRPSPGPRGPARRERPIRRSRTLEANLWQHPVGQGLFHSGAVRIGKAQPFRYVYDCGKKPGGNWQRFIGPAVSAYGRQPLDALFVSHFDSDHVNGLSDLLRAFGGAKVAFLPYLTPPRRLVLAAREEERGPSLGGDHVAFLADPASWLSDRGVAEVVFVGGPSPGTNEDGTPGVPEWPAGDKDGDESWLRYGPQNKPDPSFNVAPVDIPQPKKGALRTVGFMSHREPIVLHGGKTDVGWIFQTHVDPDPEMERAICDTVEDTFGAAAYRALCQGSGECLRILQDAKSRRKLARAYRDAVDLPRIEWLDVILPKGRARRADRSGMNRTTLSLFSGPFTNPTRQDASQFRHWLEGDAGFGTEEAWYHLDERNGWLLLGDAVLADQNVLDRLVRFFGSPNVRYLARTLAFTLPHHGSEANFSDSTLRMLGCPPIAVVPAGNRTHYNHPSESVMSLLDGHGLHVFHTHEQSTSGFRHRIELMHF